MYGRKRKRRSKRKVVCVREGREKKVARERSVREAHDWTSIGGSRRKEGQQEREEGRESTCGMDENGTVEQESRRERRTSEKRGMG